MISSYIGTELGELLLHAGIDSVKEIGCGSYARVYKMKYDRCMKENMGCRFCAKIPGDITEICLKQVYMSNLYDHDDYICEVTYQTQINLKYPEMIVKIYDHWLHETDEIPLISQHILTQPPGSAQEDNIIKCGFIITELMPGLDLHIHIKKSAQNNKNNIISGKPQILSSVISRSQQIMSRRPILGLKPTLEPTLEPTLGLEPTPIVAPINILGLLFILSNLVYIFHYEFGITHGDFRDRNIFLRYHNPMWRQICRGGYLKEKSIEIDTGGWEIKLGDFGLADKINEGDGSFIIRDYEFLDNIYCLRAKWRYNCNSDYDFNNLISLLKDEFLADIYCRITKYRRDGQTITEARHAFWFNKHRISQNSIFIYELPQRLMIKLSELLNTIGTTV